jgi:hypothetical protein
MRKLRVAFASSVLCLGLVLGSTVACAGESAPAIFVNGRRLAADIVQALERGYGVRIQPGRYWYDALSGLWGVQGGPTAGQLLPGLGLGGAPLRFDASGGATSVVINGRALHPSEIAYLQRCTPVIPGRYWMNAAGIGGFEGGPPLFNLVALCQQTAGGGAGTVYTPFGSVTQGGGITGYTPPREAVASASPVGPTAAASTTGREVRSTGWTESRSRLAAAAHRGTRPAVFLGVALQHRSGRNA